MRQKYYYNDASKPRFPDKSVYLYSCLFKAGSVTFLQWCIKCFQEMVI